MPVIAGTLKGLKDLPAEALVSFRGTKCLSNPGRRMLSQRYPLICEGIKGRDVLLAVPLLVRDGLASVGFFFLGWKDVKRREDANNQ